MPRDHFGRTLENKPRGDRPRRFRFRFRPELAALEDRRLLATFTWVSTSDGAWNNSANWKDQQGKSGVPGAADTAVIDNGSVDVTVTAPASVASLHCTGSLNVGSVTFTVANTSPSRIRELDLGAGGVFKSSNGSLTLLGGTIGGTLSAPAGIVTFGKGTTIFEAGAQLTGAGTFDLSSGQMTVASALSISHLKMTGGTIDGPGSVTVEREFDFAGGTLSGPGRLSAEHVKISDNTTKTVTNNYTLDLTGQTKWVSSGPLVVEQGAVVQNRGVFTIDVPARMLGDGGSVNNQGTLRVATGEVYNRVVIAGKTALNNSGTVNVASGTLSLAGGGTENGRFTLGGGNARLVLSGGTARFGSGSSVAGHGSFELAGATLTADIPLEIPSLKFDSGTIDSPHTMIIAGNLSWGGGRITGQGTTIVRGAADFGQGALEVAENSLLDVTGGGSWFGASLTLGAGAVVNTGKLFTFPVPPKITGPGTVNNYGTWSIRSQMRPSMRFFGGATFNNFGRGDIISYAGLTLESGSLQSGSFEIYGDSEINFAGGAHLLSGTAASFSGSGQVVLSGGVLTSRDPLSALNLSRDTEFEWKGGQIAVPAGRVLALQGGTVSLVGPGDKVVTGGGTLLLSSRTVLNGRGDLVLKASPPSAPLALHVAQKGVLVLGQGGGIAADRPGGGSILVQGVMVKREESTTTVDLPLENTGKLDLNAGTLAIRNSFTQVPAGTLEAAIGSSAAHPRLAGLSVSGTISLGGALTISDPKRIKVPLGGVLTLIANFGSAPVAGTFANLPEGAQLSLGNGMTFAISYQGGTSGRDVVLKRVD